MAIYKLTVFEKNGTLLHEQSIEAEHDAVAKEIGEKHIQENEWNEHTHRLVSPFGKLVIFHT